LQRAREATAAPRPPPVDLSEFDKLKLNDKVVSDAIGKRIRQSKRKKLPSTLPPHQLSVIQANLHNRGFQAKVGREAVSAKDIGRLCPSQWLNDEIINFWGAMLMERAERCKKAARGKEKEDDAAADPDDLGRFGHSAPLHNIHYFNTFFFAKLVDPGYEKGRLAKWTKAVDIFTKDIILIPVNLGNQHWTCAAINMKKKRIEYYDSMGSRRAKVYMLLRDYLNKEHMTKKSKPFDFTGWEDFFDNENVPQQENGWDCGVFTCMFMEGLSRGEEVEDFVFEQRNMPYLRQRLMWEISRQRLT